MKRNPVSIDLHKIPTFGVSEQSYTFVILTIYMTYLGLVDILTGSESSGAKVKC